MERISASASGLRHLRWAREILAALEMHHEHNPRLRKADRDLVLAEMVDLRVEVNALSAAVKPYRDFLERERTKLRGLVRVGRYLEETAQDAGEKAEAATIREGFDQAFAAMEARERAPRKAALRAAIAGLRAALEAMDERLMTRLPRAFVESLYPPLAGGGTLVADGPDEDDDATA